jgi:hydrogenase expression/formation protein HypC
LEPEALRVRRAAAPDRGGSRQQASLDSRTEGIRMCLAVPMRVVELDLPMGTVDLEGIRRRVHLGFLEEVKVGDYVLIHAGCAVEKLHPAEAEEDLRLLRSLLEFSEEVQKNEPSSEGL